MKARARVESMQAMANFLWDVASILSEEKHEELHDELWKLPTQLRAHYW